MDANQTRTTVLDGTAMSNAPVRVMVPDDVRAAIRERGGSLYIWTHAHGVCEGRVTFLDVATERPESVSLPFERLDAGDLEVFLAIGSLLRPEFVELELQGRRRKIRAYWNGQASVG
jgi:hypothetical protein